MVSRSALARLVDARLVAINVSRYDGDVPDTPPTIPGDAAGRVRPYLVEWFGAGSPDTAEDDLTGQLVTLGWTFQITCVAGRTGDLRPLVDDTTALLERWHPVIDGLSTGLCRQLNDPGPPRPDRSVTPTRYVLPLQYVITAGT